jgi:hypothetical protein
MMETQKTKSTINFKEDAIKAKSNVKVLWLMPVLFVHIMLLPW